MVSVANPVIWTDADASTDDAILALEEALNGPPKSPPPLSTCKRSPISTFDHLRKRYRVAKEARSPLHTTQSTSSLRHPNKDQKSKDVTAQPSKTPPRSPSKPPPKNMFANNSPPTLRFLTPGKRVCFNCYDVGHREEFCHKPKRIMGTKLTVKRHERRRGKKKSGGLSDGNASAGSGSAIVTGPAVGDSMLGGVGDGHDGDDNTSAEKKGDDGGADDGREKIGSVKADEK